MVKSTRVIPFALLVSMLLFGCGQADIPRQDSAAQLSQVQSLSPTAPSQEEDRSGSAPESSEIMADESSEPEESSAPEEETPLGADPNYAGHVQQTEPVSPPPSSSSAAEVDSQTPVSPLQEELLESPSYSMYTAVLDMETALLRLINEERSRGGVHALGMEDSLQFAAQIRAQEALESLSHTRPDGTPYHTVFDEAGFPYAGKWHGENLAVIRLDNQSLDQLDIPAALIAQWVQSSGHYQNLMSDNFAQTGIGVYIQRDDNSISIGAAQLFAGL